MPTYIKDPTPAWLKPENASVTDSFWTKLGRRLGTLIGADDPQSQVMGVMGTEARVGSEAIKNTAKRIAAPIRAYHGSPHDFDKFSTAKIGAGEGAQAYGHGLYFAENPEVAADYARRVGMRGSAFDEATLAEYFKPGRIVNAYGGKDRVLAFQPNTGDRSWSVTVQRVNDAGTPMERPRVHATAPSLADVREVLTPGRQGMYEVNLNADPEDFLDWDKPLIQQGANVRQVLSDAGISSSVTSGRAGGLRRPGDVPASSLATYAEGRGPLERADIGRDRIEVRQALQRLPGIKYLDQGSRAAGEGSRNYVVFDDSIIDILKKWALLPPAILATAKRDSLLRLMNGQDRPQ